MFFVHTTPVNFENATIAGQFRLCLRKGRAGKSQDIHDLIVLEKLRFLDGLVWTVDLTAEIKLRFLDGLVWTVGLTVEIKLRFLDGLVWTVDLTAEIKLRFLDGLVWTVGLTAEINSVFKFLPRSFCVFICKFSTLIFDVTFSKIIFYS